MIHLTVEEVALKEILSKTFLFEGIDESRIENALKNISPSIIKYNRKDIICSPSSYEHNLAFLIDGECRVDRIRHDGASVPLNVLKKGSSFGVISVFADEDEFPTKITATKDTSILYINKNDVELLIEKYHDVALNVIKFMSKKIIFLNKKVATFSEDTVVSKLASFLRDEYKKNGAEFPFNCKRSAESISVGRASLYRAISLLTDEGIIKLENKKIYIIDPDGLERKTK